MASSNSPVFHQFQIFPSELTDIGHLAAFMANRYVICNFKSLRHEEGANCAPASSILDEDQQEHGTSCEARFCRHSYVGENQKCPLHSGKLQLSLD